MIILEVHFKDTGSIIKELTEARDRLKLIIAEEFTDRLHRLSVFDVGFRLIPYGENDVHTHPVQFMIHAKKTALRKRNKSVILKRVSEKLQTEKRLEGLFGPEKDWNDKPTICLKLVEMEYTVMASCV